MILTEKIFLAFGFVRKSVMASDLWRQLSMKDFDTFGGGFPQTP
jgi:hypothetical protein